jgi:chromosome segregation ATPase
VDPARVAALLAEIERRDEAAASALAAVEELQRVVEGIRRRTATVSGFLAGLPAERERRAAAVDGAERRLAAAEAAIAAAERELERAREKDRPAAERAAAEAREEARVAAGELARAQDAVAALEAEADRAKAETEALEREAVAAASRLAALPRIAPEAAAPPAAGLDGIEAWAARARAALLVLHAALAAERDAIVREANELGSSVLGEALGATSVAGVRERVARASESGSS